MDKGPGWKVYVGGFFWSYFIMVAVCTIFSIFVLGANGAVGGGFIALIASFVIIFKDADKEHPFEAMAVDSAIVGSCFCVIAYAFVLYLSRACC